MRTSTRWRQPLSMISGHSNPNTRVFQSSHANRVNSSRLPLLATTLSFPRYIQAAHTFALQAGAHPLASLFGGPHFTLPPLSCRNECSLVPRGPTKQAHRAKSSKQRASLTIASHCNQPRAAHPLPPPHRSPSRLMLILHLFPL